MFNAPGAVRDHNEKLGDRRVPAVHRADPGDARPASGCRRSSTSTRDVVLKRLDGMGGESIFRVRADDPNRNVIVETMAQARRAQRHGAALHPRDQATATSACC